MGISLVILSILPTVFLGLFVTGENKTKQNHAYLLAHCLIRPGKICITSGIYFYVNNPRGEGGLARGVETGVIYLCNEGCSDISAPPPLSLSLQYLVCLQLNYSSYKGEFVYERDIVRKK